MSKSGPSSRPTVPCPACTSGSSYACTTSAPLAAARSWLAAYATAYSRPTCVTCAPYDLNRRTFTGDDVSGTNTSAPTPSSRAAYATASPWFPPDAAITPAAGIGFESRRLNVPAA